MIAVFFCFFVFLIIIQEVGVPDNLGVVVVVVIVVVVVFVPP